MAPTSSSPTFGSLLKRHRRIAGLTQEGLAERAGVSARGVQDLERGIHASPRAETVRLLAEALELDSEARAELIAAAHPEVVPTPSSAAIHSELCAPPLPATALVGREREVAEACYQLRPADGARATRLLTLTGPGGVGKTRLALAVAAEIAPAFDGNVAWVDLSPLRDPDLVAMSIAVALGVREAGDQHVAERLTATVTRHRLLLVLDNFEHLLPAAPLVATLLAAAPELTVLATSRARLRLRGERELPLSPLAVPATTATAAPLEGLAGVAAVRLFVERAAEVRPGFTLTEEHGPAVAEICRRLDGLPLAIELAAARTKLMSPPSLLDRLEQRLPLLTGGARDLPLRQQTMRDALAWSYDLLDPEEQAIFRRLAVFAGGFTLEGAEAVVARSLTVARPTVDVLMALVDHSLVRPVGDVTGEERFSMLETVREYGTEQLFESGEAETVRRAYAAWCLAFAERAEPELTGPAQADWFDRLDAEHANVRAAVAWSLENDRAATAERLTGALWHFWQVRGHVAEGRSWAEAALAQGNPNPTVARAKALRAAGLLAEYHGDYDQAVARHEAAAAVWGALGDERNLARTLDHLGNCAHDRGDFARAEALHEEALTLARKVGDPCGIASALGNLGIMAIHLDQLATARQRLEEALALLRELGHAHGVGVALSHLGVVALREGDLARSVTLNQEALSAWHALGDRDEAASALVQLGMAERLAGDRARALAHLESARRNFAELGNARGEASARAALGALAADEGKHSVAVAHFAAALVLARDVDDSVTAAACLDGAAGSAARLGHAFPAVRLLGAAAALREALAIPVPAHLRADHEQAMSAARAAIDGPAFAAAWEAGRTLPIAQATTEALGLAPELS